jgi:hypothetical protein
MDQTRIDAVTQELMDIKPFEWQFVNRGPKFGVVSTYMVNRRVVAPGVDDVSAKFEPLFYRTVDLITRETIELYKHPSLSADAYIVLAEHYNEKYVINDGINSMFQFVDEVIQNVEVKSGVTMCTLEKHEKFGQVVHYQDIDELRMTDGTTIDTVSWAPIG